MNRLAYNVWLKKVPWGSWTPSRHCGDRFLQSLILQGIANSVGERNSHCDQAIDNFGSRYILCLKFIDNDVLIVMVSKSQSLSAYRFLAEPDCM